MLSVLFQIFKKCWNIRLTCRFQRLDTIICKCNFSSNLRQGVKMLAFMSPFNVAKVVIACELHILGH